MRLLACSLYSDFLASSGACFSYSLSILNSAKTASMSLSAADFLKTQIAKPKKMRPPKTTDPRYQNNTVTVDRSLTVKS